MILKWSDSKGAGIINGEHISTKPVLGFEYEYLNFIDGVGEYCPRERINYPEVTRPSIDEVVNFYENRGLDEYQIKAVSDFIVSWTPPSLTAEQLFDITRERIRSLARDAFQEPVEVDGLMWRGGQDSAQSIFNAVNMAEYSGLSEIQLRDASRKPHTYQLDAAKGIAAAIGADYQLKWQAEEQALLDLAEIDLTAADAIDQINQIMAQFGG